MNIVLRCRVVIIVDVRADTVHQRRMQGIQPLGTSQHSRGWLTGKWPQRTDGNVEGRMKAATNGAPEIVDESSSRFVLDIAGNLAKPAGDHVLGKRFGFGHSAKVIVYVFRFRPLRFGSERSGS